MGAQRRERKGQGQGAGRLEGTEQVIDQEF
jgi:hypothetical protein